MKSTAAAACAVALIVALPHSARADHVTPPQLPTDLAVPGHKAFLIAHAYGTQNYVCLPAATPSGFGWTLHGPQATLFDEEGEQQMTHFFSRNPDEVGMPIRAAWQHSRDTSVVWAFAAVTYTNSDYVAPGAIPWLKLQVVGKQFGPTGGDRLTRTTFIQRVNTAGGRFPDTGCAAAADLGKRALVPYETDYVFYRERNPGS